MFNPPLEGELGYEKRGICWALPAPPVSLPPLPDCRDLLGRKGFISRTKWSRLDGLEFRWRSFQGQEVLGTLRLRR